MATRNCPKCGRPLWDGGHALNPAECEGEADERCDLLAEIAVIKHERDSAFNVLGMCLLHLMVRPHMRLPQAEENLKQSIKNILPK